MVDNPELRQVDATVRSLVTKLRDDLYPTSTATVQRKRVVVNYDPLYEIAELPQIILEGFLLGRNLFQRQVGFEAPEKVLDPDYDYTQRAYPVYLDMVFTLVVVTDKARDLFPLHERLIAWVEANKYLTVGEEVSEPYEAYEYSLNFEDPIGQSSLVPTDDHLNRLSLRGVVESVRIYPGIQLSGKLVRYRIFRFFEMDGETQLEEIDIDSGVSS